MQDTIKKRDVLNICKRLSEAVGPFNLYSPEGKTLFSSTTEETVVTELKEKGEQLAVLKGGDDRVYTVAGILECYLQELKEKKKIINHTLMKYRELSFLAELSEILSSSLDINETLKEVTRRIKEVVGVENCSIMTVDPEDGRFILRAVSGRVVNEPCWLDVSTGVAAKVYRSGKAVLINEPGRDCSFVQGGKTAIDTLLCVPLRVKDKTVGVLNLSNKYRGGFSSEDESLLLMTAVMIAGAIETYNLLEEKLRQERFATIGQMAAGIIHDIKNPMATIKGFAGLLGDMEFSPEERKEYSRLIVDEVNRLVEMVEDLLAFTRGFKKRLSLKEVGMEEFINDVLPYIKKEMSGKNIDVITRIDYRGSVIIDPDKFKRVVYNISSNAKDALQQGGRFLIACRSPDDSHVEIVLADNGKGIAEEILHRVFEPFITKGKSKGTGLGLAIAKKIVQEHGGEIKAVNMNYTGIEDFNGANFVITLPVKGASG